MLSFYFTLGLIILFSLGEYHSRSREKKGLHPGVLYRFWGNIGNSFTSPYIYFYLLAIVGTLLFVFTKYDTYIQNWFQIHEPLGRTFPFFCLIAGNFWHIFVGLILASIGKYKKKSALIDAGLASIQAVFASMLVITFLKMVSGRRGPLNLFKGLLRAYDSTGMYGVHKHAAPFIKTTDIADFRFDFWNHIFSDGRFFWPSGHTATIVAFVAALVAFFPERRWIKIIGYPFAFLVAMAMIAGDFHWASDIWGGALIGWAIGKIVGNKFRAKQG